MLVPTSDRNGPLVTVRWQKRGCDDRSSFNASSREASKLVPGFRSLLSKVQAKEPHGIRNDTIGLLVTRLFFGLRGLHARSYDYCRLPPSDGEAFFRS